jgi:hypothetical protein
MKAFSANLIVLVVFVLGLAAMGTVYAQTGSKALFGPEWDPPWICVGGGFVAMLGKGYHQPLVVVAIDSNGIEAPKKLSVEGNEVFGMQCVGSYIELQARETDSDHFSVLPFRVEQGAIERQPREDIDYSLTLKGPMPSVIERRLDQFLWGGYKWTQVGDWYVHVLRVVGNSNHAYAVHFVHTETRSRLGLEFKLVVDLLEQSFEKKLFSVKDAKITRLVPLIREFY